jgi:hypothetical protein
MKIRIIISCILIRCNYDKSLEMIQPLVQEVCTFCVFSFGPLVTKRRIRLDQNLVSELLLPSGTYEQSFESIARSSGYKTCPANVRRRTPRDRIGSPGEPKVRFYPGRLLLKECRVIKHTMKQVTSILVLLLWYMYVVALDFVNIKCFS